MTQFRGLVLLAAVCSVLSLAHALTPPQPLWNQPRAEKLLPLAFAAYCPSKVVQDWSCWWCSHEGTPQVTVHGTFHALELNVVGYVGTLRSPVENTNYIVAVFRGTADLVNLLLDLNFAPREFLPFSGSGATVHGGFYDAYNSVAPTVTELLDKAVLHCKQTLGGDCQIRFIGHSLGGAIATIAAASQCPRMRNGTLPRNPACFLDTYSAPRVGNEAFVNILNGVVWFHGSVRMTHQTDPIPHVPPMFTGYRHLPGEVWQFVDTPAPKFEVCSSSFGEDLRCSNGPYHHFSPWSMSNWTNVLTGVAKYHSNYFGVALSLSAGHCQAFQNNACNLCFSILTIIKNQLKDNTVPQVVEKARPFCNLLKPYQGVCMTLVNLLVTAVASGNFICDCTPGQIDPPLVIRPLFELLERHARYNAKLN